jgi:hypothetical protein
MYSHWCAQYGYQPIEKPNLNFDLRKLVAEPPRRSAKKSARKPLASIDNVNMSQVGYGDEGLITSKLGDDFQAEADMTGVSFLQHGEQFALDASQSYFVEDNQLLQNQKVAHTPLLRQGDLSTVDQALPNGSHGTPEQTRRPIENAKTPRYGKSEGWLRRFARSDALTSICLCRSVMYTRSLDDWKLSAATRQILQQGKHSTVRAERQASNSRRSSSNP